MFKKSYNRATLSLRIETVTPLLIQAGDPGLDPSAADLACVRTHHARHGRTVYIPGSSLKGVVRSAAEATVRGQTFGGVEGACDPLGEQACGQKPDSPVSRSTDVHRGHCLACRVFGSTRMAGRGAVRDLFPWRSATGELAEADSMNLKHANRVELRHGVAIDRVKGSVKHGPFDLEMVPPGVMFWGEIVLQNYQAWQLGLIAQALGELEDGFAQLGSNKTSGFGVVRPQVVRILHEQPARHGDAPLGVGAMVSGEEAQGYGLLAEGALPGTQSALRGLNRRFVVEGEATRAWLDAGREALGSLA